MSNPSAAPSTRIDYSAELNRSQLEAVLHGAGPMLIVAGAGSGKTRTLVYRVARLVDSGVAPETILLLTFTRKAAEEMIRRATELLDSRCGDVVGGTFHSFAARHLRSHAGALGFSRNFTIHDRADSDALIGRERDAVLKEIEAARGKPGKFPSKALLGDLFSRCVNRDETIEDALGREAPEFYGFLDEIKEIRRRYTASKKEKNILDYDDILVFFLDLLRDHPAARERIARRYAHILVDEYQDTNRIQAETLKLLAFGHNNVVAVGDDAQSIYGFRGARHKNILEFPSLFPGARIVKMEENYRSVQPILDFTNAVIDAAHEKIPKTLRTTRHGGKVPEIYSTDGERSQALFVANNVEVLRRRGVPLREIAVLFRAGNMADSLEVILAKMRIPYKKFGGVRFLESAHIKDVLAHLRFSENPLDAVSLRRALLLCEGVGPKTAENVIRDVTAAAKAGAGAGEILAAIEKCAKPGALQFANLLGRITGRKPEDAYRYTLDYYLPILSRTFEDNDQKWRREHLEQTQDLASQYGTMEQFLNDVTLDPPSEEEHIDGGDKGDYLTLSTIHSAKGLEWQYVFIVWVLEGKMPPAHPGMGRDEIEEERRLFYVAATRAKDRLIMSYPSGVLDRFTQAYLHRPSRFVDGLPSGVVRRGEASEDTCIRPV